MSRGYVPRVGDVVRLRKNEAWFLTLHNPSDFDKFRDGLFVISKVSGFFPLPQLPVNLRSYRLDWHDGQGPALVDIWGEYIVPDPFLTACARAARGNIFQRLWRFLLQTKSEVCRIVGMRMRALKGEPVANKRNCSKG